MRKKTTEERSADRRRQRAEQRRVKLAAGWVPRPRGKPPVDDDRGHDMKWNHDGGGWIVQEHLVGTGWDSRWRSAPPPLHPLAPPSARGLVLPITQAEERVAPPAASAWHDKLPAQCIMTASDSDVEKNCDICWEWFCQMKHFQVGEKICSLPCKHTYHWACIERCLVDMPEAIRANQCPVCREGWADGT